VLSRLGDDVQCFGTTDWTTTQGKRKKAMEGWTEGKFPRHASLRGIPPEAVEITSYSP
jgi:hypothetical protein